MVDFVLFLTPRLQLLRGVPQEDVVLLLRVVELVTLGPIVARRVGEDVPVVVEAARGDGLVQLFRRLQLGPGVFVPETEPAIGANGGQSAVYRMEGDGVYGINVLGGGRVCPIGPVTFKCKVVFGWIRGVDVMDGNSTFDASQSKTGRLVLFIFKYGDTSVLML